MRILVVRTGSLFGHDDTKLYASRLCSAIAALGHTVELTTIPFSGSIADVVPETAAYRLLDLRHGGDMCIALGPFAHAISHSNKRIWFFEPYAPLYDLWGTDYGAVTVSPTNAIVRSHVHAMDRAWLLGSRSVWAASETLSTALLHQCGKPTPLLRPGVLDDLLPVMSDRSNSLVVAARIADRSRLPLIIAAFEAVTLPATLVILGYETSPEEREYVEQLIAVSPKRGSITLEVSPDAARFRHAAGAAAALIVAGYRCSTADVFLLAAGRASVPVITTTDSGEAASLVNDDASGYVVDAEPAALAHAMSHVLADPKSATRRGRALSAKLGRLLPGWDSIALELTR